MDQLTDNNLVVDADHMILRGYIISTILLNNSPGDGTGDTSTTISDSISVGHCRAVNMAVLPPILWPIRTQRLISFPLRKLIKSELISSSDISLM